MESIDFSGIHQALGAAFKTCGGLSRTKACVGFDGTVDKIVSVVDKRTGEGEAYTPIPTIADFGARISAAAGKSTNLELFLRQEKIGGNAAIMAGALSAAGVTTTLVADMGAPRINRVFENLSKRATLKSLGAPTETHAMEFGDGKVMLCYTRNHEAISFEAVQKALGGRGGLKRTLEESDFIAMVNWTMIPNMTGIWKKLLAEVLPTLKNSHPLAPSLGEGEDNKGLRPLNPGSFTKTNEGCCLFGKAKIYRRRKFFFDLADPQKRPAAELKEALETIAKFSAFGEVILGANLKESQQCAAALGLPSHGDSLPEVEAAAQRLRERLGLAIVTIHLVQTASCATAAGAWSVTGPNVVAKIKTGAGDHFNAGFASAVMLEATPLAALTLGVAFSGYYVATAKSPTFAEAMDMIKQTW